MTAAPSGNSLSHATSRRPSSTTPCCPGSRPSSARFYLPGSAGRCSAPMGKIAPSTPYRYRQGCAHANVEPPMALRIAEALGIVDEVGIARIPADVQACSSGSRCCWRWLARAALEHVGGSFLSTSMGRRHASLSELVSLLKAEVSSVNKKSDALEECQNQIARDAEKLAVLKQLDRVNDTEIAELQSIRKELAQARAECLELRSSNGRLIAGETRFENELAASHQSAMVNKKLFATKIDAEESEHNAGKAGIEIPYWEEKYAAVMNEVNSNKAEIGKLRKRIASAKMAARWRRVLRGKGGGLRSRSRAQARNKSR
eukprot:TRINITY_DN65084_c0_g1_i1.p1 TRINITY_DN65084_c0_g1~~TRINITY_DN65084_c0_g1_i1.p1  ORF type:complete len:316 (-),score=37.81 TRINITY_DN65084_c0_g1_i1:175-1122(-)